MDWKVWRDDEPVYKDRSWGRQPGVNADNQSLLEASAGSIDITSYNPLGRPPINETATVPEALVFYDEAAERIGGTGGQKLTIRYDENGESLMYTLRLVHYREDLPIRSVHPGMYRPHTVFEGEIAGVSRGEVEPYLSSLIDIDRRSQNWLFDNVEGDLDEFIQADNEYSVPVDAVQKTLDTLRFKNARITDVRYNGKVFEADTPQEIIDHFLAADIQEETNTVSGLTASSHADIDETQTDAGLLYTITVDTPPAEPDIDAALEIDVTAQTEIIDREKPHVNEAAKDVANETAEETENLL